MPGLGRVARLNTYPKLVASPDFSMLTYQDEAEPNEGVLIQPKTPNVPKDRKAKPKHTIVFAGSDRRFKRDFDSKSSDENSSGSIPHASPHCTEAGRPSHQHTKRLDVPSVHGQPIKRQTCCLPASTRHKNEIAVIATTSLQIMISTFIALLVRDIQRISKDMAHYLATLNAWCGPITNAVICCINTEDSKQTVHPTLPTESVDDAALRRAWLPAVPKAYVRSIKGRKSYRIRNQHHDIRSYHPPLDQRGFGQKSASHCAHETSREHGTAACTAAKRSDGG